MVMSPLICHARNGIYGICSKLCQTGLMPANFTTLPHFSVSSAISFPKSEGVHRHRHAAQFGKPCFHFGIGDARVDLFIEPIDDVGGCVLRQHRRQTTSSPHSLGTKSPTVGISGSASDRVAVVTASARSLPALMCSSEVVMLPNITCTCPPSRSGNARASPR